MSEPFSDSKMHWVKESLEGEFGFEDELDIKKRLIATVEKLQKEVADKTNTINIQGKMLQERDDLKLDPEYMMLRDELKSLREDNKNLRRIINDDT